MQTSVTWQTFTGNMGAFFKGFLFKSAKIYDGF